MNFGQEVMRVGMETLQYKLTQNNYRFDVLVTSDATSWVMLVDNDSLLEYGEAPGFTLTNQFLF